MEPEVERGALEIEDPKMDKIDTGNPKGVNLKLVVIIFALFIVAIAVILILYFALSSSSTDPNSPEKPDTPPSPDTPDEETDKIWGNSYKKAKEFVSKLTLKDKLGMFYGTENYYGEGICVGQIDKFQTDKVNFPGMCLQDGPAGVRFAKGTAISWQSSINTACTFNKELMYQIGLAQGEENKQKGINTFLSPSVNIMRTPQSGRIWEAYGEDPYYAGVCATQLIKGIQEKGVIATIKHYVCNDQESYREKSSSNVGMQALMDIYVEPFYRPIKEANVASFMCGFNAVNNTYSCENSFLLNDVLRGILGFKGFVMSDWWAITNNSTKSFNAGLEVNMPGGMKYGKEYQGRNGSYWSEFESYVKDGQITEDRINQAATRILAAMYQLNQMENYPKVNLLYNTTTEERMALHRRAAIESQVLLKNDGILPLRENITSIGVIGNDAFDRDCENGDGDKQCKNTTNEVSNGHIPIGYGSGTTDFDYLVTPWNGITAAANRLNRNLSLSATGGLRYTDVERGGEEEGEEKYRVHIKAEELIEQAVELAKKVDVAIVFVAADSGESYLQVETSKGDRLDLDLWHNGNDLIGNVSEANPNTIVVINAPGVVNVPWLDKVRAVVFSGFPGMESGNAIASVLFGENNPSGHLPYAWGKLEDYGVDYIKLEDGTEKKELVQYDYKEGLYVGQRWFNKHNKKPIFPFGWGLSYSEFVYSDLKLSMSKEGLKATFNILNNSTVIGSAVPMMFITFPSDIGDYPQHIFKGFNKVEIKPKDTVEVEILADDHALSYFNVDKNNWVRVNSGSIHVAIAENADPDNVLLKGDIDGKY